MYRGYELVVKGYTFKVRFDVEGVYVYCPDLTICFQTWLGIRDTYGTGDRAVKKFVGYIIGHNICL